MAKQSSKLSESEVGALLFGVGLLAGVGATVAAFVQSWEYSLLALIAALVILRVVSRNR